MNGISNYQSSAVNFYGRVDKKTAKFAKSLGGDVLETLQSKAKSLDKNTVLAVEDGSSKNVLTGIYAYNTKLGGRAHLAWTNNAELASTVKKLEPAKVEEKIIDESIKYIKSEADTYPLRGFARKELKAEAKENLRVQREFGINKPFWGEAKKNIKKAEERAAQERLEFHEKYFARKRAAIEDKL